MQGTEHTPVSWEVIRKTRQVKNTGERPLRLRSAMREKKSLALGAHFSKSGWESCFNESFEAEASLVSKVVNKKA